MALTPARLVAADGAQTASLSMTLMLSRHAMSRAAEADPVVLRLMLRRGDEVHAVSLGGEYPLALSDTDVQISRFTDLKMETPIEVFATGPNQLSCVTATGLLFAHDEPPVAIGDVWAWIEPTEDPFASTISAADVVRGVRVDQSPSAAAVRDVQSPPDPEESRPVDPGEVLGGGT